MKKNLLFTLLLGMLIPICSFGQDNLLENGDFELPGTGKYRGDCGADGCFNGTVPGWWADPGVTDAGVEADDARGAYAGFSFTGDDGVIFQVVGEIDAVQRDFTLTYWSKVSWSSASADTPDELYFVTYFFSFSGTDTANKVILDTLAVLDEGWASDEAARDDEYYLHTHQFIVPQSEVGKNLAIGFDGAARNETVDPSSCWMHFDDLVLVVYDATGIEKAKREHAIEIYPNPSQGLIEVKSLSSVISTIEIFDITGKLVLTQTDNNNIIDLTNKDKGVYFLRATTKTNDIITKKLIIE